MGNRGKETSSFMREFIEKCGGYAVIDGGFATELERHGADLNDALWSAKCLIESSDLVRRVCNSTCSFFFLYRTKGKKGISLESSLLENDLNY